MFLSQLELQTLTGYRRPGAQIRWLGRNGYRFTVSGSGTPVVAMAEFNRHMVGGKVSRSEPNWNGLEKLIQAG